MKATRKVTAKVRASWQLLLTSVLRLTYRVQAGLERRVDALPLR